MMLKPFELFYHFVSSVKNELYEKNIFKSVKLSVPVISVGNLSFGGTGKTPFIEFLVQQFFQDKKVSVICKSYQGLQSKPEKVDLKRENFAQYFGDEASLLQSRLHQVEVWSGPKKYKSAQAALNGHPDILLIDDGFSHRQLKRQLDLVLIDATRFLKDYHRESIKSLQRAQAIILTKTNLVTQENLENQIKYLSLHNVSLSDQLFLAEVETQLEVSKQDPLMVFCGIGNPQSFKTSLEKLGYQISLFKSFKDHVHYTDLLQKEIYSTYTDSQKIHPNLKLVTTAKDDIKIKKVELKNKIRIAEVKIKMKTDEQKRLFEKIRSAL